MVSPTVIVHEFRLRMLDMAMSMPLSQKKIDALRLVRTITAEQIQALNPQKWSNFPLTANGGTSTK